jgi:hypothetical protein
VWYYRKPFDTVRAQFALPSSRLSVISRYTPRSAVAWTSLAAIVAGMALGTPATAAGQDVFGHTPEGSPYHDVESPTELSLFAGYLVTGKDPAGVSPGSAPILGVREMIHLDGPAIFYVRVSHSFSDRDAIDPASPPGLRALGTVNDGLTIGDLGIGMNLTGDRSWHNLMPYFGAGPGVVSDLGVRRDVGGYHFGTAFAITYGGGLRWVPDGRLSVHLDANMYMWAHHDPPSYHVNSYGPPVVPITEKLIAWRNNGMFVLGLSYQIRR